jgi:hypothetical protein
LWTLAADIGRRAVPTSDRAGTTPDSVERLVVALFHALEPYALAVADLCSSFNATMCRTGQGLRIRFRFEKVTEVGLRFDPFREWLRIWDEFTWTVESCVGI